MSKIGQFINDHPDLAIAGGLLLLLIIGASILRQKNGTTSASNVNPNSTSGDTSGLLTDSQGNKLVYVPTQTTFSTQNENIGAEISNDPSLTSFTTGNIGPVGSPNEGNTTTTTTNNPPPVVVPPVVVPPPIVIGDNDDKKKRRGKTATIPIDIGPGSFPGTPHLNPGGIASPPIVAPVQQARSGPPPQLGPTTTSGLVWNTGLSVSGRQTLSSVASQVTRGLRAQGMPHSMSVTTNDLWANNQDTIAHPAQQTVKHGTTLIVPTWGGS